MPTQETPATDASSKAAETGDIQEDAMKRIEEALAREMAEEKAKKEAGLKDGPSVTSPVVTAATTPLVYLLHPSSPATIFCRRH